MKKILSLLIVLFLITTNIIFATETEQNNSEPDPQSEQSTQIGLYFYIETGPNTYDYINNLYLSLGAENRGDFYFFDGSNYTKIDIGNLIPSENIKLALKLDRRSPEDPGVVKTTVSSSATGAGTVSYKNGNNTYSMNVTTSLPSVALYSENNASDSTYVWGLYNYEAGKTFYLKNIEENSSISDVSVGYYGQSGFVVVPFAYDSDTQSISWAHRKSTSYNIKFKYKSSDGEIRDYSVFVSNNRDLTAIPYGSDYVTFGIAFDNNQNNLHITNGYGDYTSDYPKTVTFVLAAGILYDGASAIVANEEVYNSISNVSYTAIATDGMKESDYSVSISSEKISAYERQVYPVTISFAANAKGTLNLTIYFDIKMPDGSTKRIDTFQYFTLTEERKLELELNNSDDIATILSSYDKLKAHFSTQDFDDVNSIKVKLPDGGSFTGALNIDMGAYNTHNGKEFELICTGENRYTINGDVDIKGGYITFSGIKFNSTAEGENDVAVKATAPDNSHSVGYVYNCEFNNYDYAVKSVDRGTIIGVDNSIFRNCKYGYYIDCHDLDTSMSRGNSQYNKFINCDNAIVMMSAPRNAPMFSWRFIDNEFFNDNPDSYDFVVGESNGVLYCQENYYAINENNVSDSSNLRSARVNYANTTGTEVVTNPCVRYYNSVFRLGIDPADGLYTRIFSGRASQINSADINNLREIGITGSNGQELIGKLNW